MQSFQITIVVLIAVVVGLAYLGSAPEPNHAKPVDDAYAAARHFILPKLLHPETAVFPEGDYTATPTGKNRWRVKSYVDSRNMFGATVRANWTIEVERRPEGWYPVTEHPQPLER